MTDPLTIIHGDCVEVMRAMPEASIDAVVTDPPYGIGFMGREWDMFRPEHVAARIERDRRKTTPTPPDHRGNKAGSLSSPAKMRYDESLRGNRAFQAWTEEWATAALRVLKPGAHLLSFCGPRTYHRMAAGIEDAGFELRDCIAWLHGQGFPKSKNLHGAWDGWGTGLKPAFEPIIVARKPFDGTVERNVADHGTGALHIDATRVGLGAGGARDGEASASRRYADRGATDIAATPGPRGGDARGRWPANVVLDDEAAAELDEQSGELVSGANPTHRASDKFRTTYGAFKGAANERPLRGIDRGGASRFFYTAKADKHDRGDGNTHPTVKPVDLMRWLVRLVTPTGGVVLDPFAGSGTTGQAALAEGFRCVLIEREAEYVEGIRRWRAAMQLGLGLSA